MVLLAALSSPYIIEHFVGRFRVLLVILQSVVRTRLRILKRVAYCLAVCSTNSPERTQTRTMMVPLESSQFVDCNSQLGFHVHTPEDRLHSPIDLFTYGQGLSRGASQLTKWNTFSLVVRACGGNRKDVGTTRKNYSLNGLQYENGRLNMWGSTMTNDVNEHSRLDRNEYCWVLYHVTQMEVICHLFHRISPKLHAFPLSYTP